MKTLNFNPRTKHFSEIIEVFDTITGVSCKDDILTIKGLIDDEETVLNQQYLYPAVALANKRMIENFIGV